MLLCLAACLAGVQGAQFDARHELGQRVRDLERQYLAAEVDSPRREALVVLSEAAVQRFFRADFAGAATALDGVWAAEGPVSVGAGGWVVTPERRLLDASAEILTLEVERWYGAPTVEVGALFRCGDPSGAPIPNEDPTPSDVPGASKLVAAPLRFALGIQAAGPGDHDWLVCPEFRGEGIQPGSRGRAVPVHVSIVAGLAERLAALEAGVAALGDGAPALERASLVDTVQLLGTLAQGPLGETDFPAARLLAEAEAQLLAASQGESWFGTGHPGEFWLSLPQGRRSQRLRLFAPEVEAGESRPLVLALHGAGGSENMWFDGYGDGLAVELARERGWFFAAPRLGLFGGDVGWMVAALAERFAIDRSRVVLLGHSMGVGRLLQTVAAAPERFAGCIALGGGQKPKDAQLLARLPWFIASAERDFALSGARALHQGLARAAAERLEWREYSDAEHLLVVPRALPEAFQWLDGCIRSTDR